MTEDELAFCRKRFDILMASWRTDIGMMKVTNKKCYEWFQRGYDLAYLEIRRIQQDHLQTMVMDAGKLLEENKKLKEQLARHNA